MFNVWKSALQSGCTFPHAGNFQIPIESLILGILILVCLCNPDGSGVNLHFLSDVCQWGYFIRLLAVRTVSLVKSSNLARLDKIRLLCLIAF